MCASATGCGSATGAPGQRGAASRRDGSGQNPVADSVSSVPGLSEFVYGNRGRMRCAPRRVLAGSGRAQGTGIPSRMPAVGGLPLGPRTGGCPYASGEGGVRWSVPRERLTGAGYHWTEYAVGETDSGAGSGRGCKVPGCNAETHRKEDCHA